MCITIIDMFDTNMPTEYNETQCDKRNTYRRKVKEEKAAAAERSAPDAPDDPDTATGANGAVNGHAEGEGEDEDRPAKKFKAEDGSAVAPDANGLDDDEMDGDQDGEQEAADDRLDDDDEDESEPVVLVDPENVAAGGVVRDEALDDLDSDSDGY